MTADPKPTNNRQATESSKGPQHDRESTPTTGTSTHPAIFTISHFHTATAESTAASSDFFLCRRTSRQAAAGSCWTLLAMLLGGGWGCAVGRLGMWMKTPDHCNTPCPCPRRTPRASRRFITWFGLIWSDRGGGGVSRKGSHRSNKYLIQDRRRFGLGARPTA